ncbi:MAG: hypothetical protein DRN05_05995 [Thermoplasmata archaeon]|nr:MAG: hypothetical protein DRN05_05995 [Thermoplasmata archaeon]
MRLKALLVIMCLAISMIPIGIIGGFKGFQYTTLFLVGIIITVTFFVSLIISFLISRPLEKLTKNIDEISKGNLDVALEKSEIYEINNLTNSLNRVLASLKLAIHKVGVKKGEIFEETVKAKEEIEEKYKDLLENLDGWTWEIDEDGTIKSCSPKITEILGYQPEEIIGKNILELMPPHETKNMKNILNKIGKKPEHFRLENWYLHKDGHKICILTTGTPIFNKNGKLQGYRAIDRDITEYKQMEEKIKELNNRLKDKEEKIQSLLNECEKLKKTSITIDNLGEKWLENNLESIFIFDEQANIIDCNENMHKKLGYTKGEMLSLNITDFDALLQNKDDIRKKIDEIKKHGSISFKTIHKRKDGSAMLVSETMQYLKDTNRFRCIVREDTI